MGSKAARQSISSSLFFSGSSVPRGNAVPSARALTCACTFIDLELLSRSSVQSLALMDPK
jgi:hypothetical protein